MGATVSEADIVKYYDDCHVDYKIVWHLESKGCMHYGYWDHSTPNLRSALVNMNKKVAEFGKINPGSLVLDAGCGVGGSSFFLADHFHCNTVGITLSHKQVAYATQKATTLGLSEKASFSRQNFTATDFPSNYFDTVWAIESVCHAEEKGDFLKEAFRILKPGGTLVMADFFANPSLAKPQQRWLDKWAASWAIPGFETTERFIQKAASEGFIRIHTSDITTNIHPTVKRLYYCFVPGIICDGFLRRFGKRSRMNKLNVWSTLYQYKCFMKSACTYQLFKATKPL